MLETLRRLLSPEYLIVSEPGPLGGLWALYLILGILFAAGLAVALWMLVRPGRRSQPPARRAWAWFELWVCLAGLGTVVGRFLGWPGWSARIWPYSLAALALAGVVAYRLRRLRLPAFVVTQLRILSFSLPPRQPIEVQAQELNTTHSTMPLTAGEERHLIPPPTESEARSEIPHRSSNLQILLVLSLHLMGIGLVTVGRWGWPWWSAPLVLLLLLTPQVTVLLRYRRPSLMALTPLLAAYAATLLWLAYTMLDITIIGWQGLTFPNPMVSLFYVDGVILAAVAYSTLCQLHITSTITGKPARFWRWAVAALLILTLTWAATVYFGKRTHGATASDPYAYAQMGVDLAERGTFLHRYSLFEQVIPLDIAWAPLQPVGYHIPRNDLGDCPSVWATGASVLLAAGYKLLGEVGLYVTTPVVALLALAATWALVQETLRRESHSVRYLTAALTLALLATSPEHVDRLLVPMADAPAQLFTVLALLFLVRGMHHLEDGHHALWPFLLAGICFGWAYWVRHTQLVLALPAIMALLLGTRTRWHARADSESRRWSLTIRPLLVFSAAAFVAAMPDIIYRWRVFGGPLATETTELPLMGLQHIGPVAWQMLRDALAAGEWGYLFPLALYGAYRLIRRHLHEAIVLGSAFVAVLLVHLTYHSLRLRDLISLFPLLDLAVAYGAVVLVRRIQALARNRAPRLGALLLPAAVISWVILSLALSRWAMIDNMWKRGWASFGYMRPEHRAAFDRLAELTSPEAVIGASLNAGAVMLYAERDAVRPYDSWTGEEWAAFLEAMEANQRPVYLLDDGGLMADFIEAQDARFLLTPVEELQIPLFYTRDRETGWLYQLEWEP